MPLIFPVAMQIPHIGNFHVVNFSVCKYFVESNFRGSEVPTKFIKHKISFPGSTRDPCNANKHRRVMEYETACCVRGYHVYREIWGEAVGEVLVCEREPRNATDQQVRLSAAGISEESWKY